MNDIIYTPPGNKRLALLLSASLLLVSLTVAAVPSYLGRSSLLSNVLALCTGAAGVWWMARFYVQSFRYEIRDGNLYVTRLTGKRELLVCDLTLKTAIGVFRGSDKKEIRSRYGKTTGVVNNYTVSPFASDSVRLLLLYSDGSARSCLILEGDDTFAASLRQAVSALSPDADTSAATD